MSGQTTFWEDTAAPFLTTEQLFDAKCYDTILKEKFDETLNYQEQCAQKLVEAGVDSIILNPNVTPAVKQTFIDTANYAAKVRIIEAQLAYRNLCEVASEMATDSIVAHLGIPHDQITPCREGVMTLQSNYQNMWKYLQEYCRCQNELDIFAKYRNEFRAGIWRGANIVHEIEYREAQLEEELKWAKGGYTKGRMDFAKLAALECLRKDELPTIGQFLESLDNTEVLDKA